MSQLTCIQDRWRRAKHASSTRMNGVLILYTQFSMADAAKRGNGGEVAQQAQEAAAAAAAWLTGGGGAHDGSKDHQLYDTLGVAEDASSAEIRAAYSERKHEVCSHAHF